MCNFWNFGHLPSFLPKYGSFENWPVSWKPQTVERILKNLKIDPYVNEPKFILVTLFGAFDRAVKQMSIYKLAP